MMTGKAHAFASLIRYRKSALTESAEFSAFVAKGINRFTVVAQTTLGRRQAARQRVLIPPFGGSTSRPSHFQLAGRFACLRK